MLALVLEKNNFVFNKLCTLVNVYLVKISCPSVSGMIFYASYCMGFSGFWLRRAKVSGKMVLETHGFCF